MLSRCKMEAHFNSTLSDVNDHYGMKNMFLNELTVKNYHRPNNICERYIKDKVTAEREISPF